MEQARPRTALAMIDASHRRHDERLDLLTGAADRLATGAARMVELEEVTDAVAFFSRSVANHFADEDDVVFPALEKARPDLATALHALSAEHPGLVELHAEVRKEVVGWNDALPTPEAALRFLTLTKELVTRYREHAGREDALLAGVTLDDADGAILGAMEARRGGGGGGGGGGGRGGGGGGGGGGRGGGGGGGGQRG